MDQQLVSRPQGLASERLEARSTFGALGVVGHRVELPARQLQPEQRVVELRRRAPERSGDLLDDLLLERGLRLLGVEATPEAVEVRALVSPTLQRQDECFPRRLRHDLPIPWATARADRPHDLPFPSDLPAHALPLALR